MLKKFCDSHVLDMGISVRRDNTACELSFKLIWVFVMETPEGKCLWFVVSHIQGNIFLEARPIAVKPV